jgi:diguanylate cyclase (GGDEF)-like protein
VIVTLSACMVIVASVARLLMALGSAREASEAAQQSLVDAATRLPNRLAFVRAVDGALAMGSHLGLMVVDIRGMKDVNDGFGLAAGDSVIELVAQRLQPIVPIGGLLARLGGDEFGIVAPTSDLIVLRELGEAAREAGSVEAILDGITVSVRVAVGVSRRLEGDHSASDLLRRADHALYAARVSGTDVEVYWEGEDGDALARYRLELAQGLREALRSRTLDVRYLPSMDAQSGEITGVEALLRWEHPQDGPVPPAIILPVARREGLMYELSRQVADRMLADLADWRRSGLVITGTLNVGPPELLDGLFVPWLIEALPRFGLEPGAVRLDVTEDAFVDEPERARQVLAHLHDAGIAVTIDHFGAGFSSLSYLRALTVDELKFDRSFFASICEDPRSAVIVQSTVAMAHALGLRVVAEGVETEDVAARAIVLGVDSLQGYFLSEALRRESVPAFVAYVSVGERLP